MDRLRNGIKESRRTSFCSAMRKVLTVLGVMIYLILHEMNQYLALLCLYSVAVDESLPVPVQGGGGNSPHSPLLPRWTVENPLCFKTELFSCPVCVGSSGTHSSKGSCNFHCLINSKTGRLGQLK